MELIGMLDSPYVRRVAVSLQLLGLPFTHQSISVFRGFEKFAAINPVVKAPSLVCDDGSVLMDSTLMLDYAESLAAPRKSLMPSGAPERLRALRLIGLALAACEKSVQIVYEHHVRPAEKLHTPWLERVTGQLLAACDGLEVELAREPLAATEAAIDQAGVTTAVAWHFITQVKAYAAPTERYPLLTAFTIAAERLPAFAAASHGEGVYPTT
jgi:glutathione S-transferase